LLHKTQGDLLPFDQRDLHHRNFVFDLPIRSGSTAKVYLRVDTESAMSLPMRIWTRDSFTEKDHLEQAILMLYYGAILMMMLYNISLFIYLRDLSYLYYVFYIFSAALVFAVQNGVAYEYLWPDWVWWNNRAQSMSVLIASIATIVFCRSFLHTEDSFPRMNKFLKYWVIFNFIATIASVFLPFTVALRMASLQVVINALLSISTGVVVLARGFVVARFYLLAWSVLLMGAILAALRNFGYLPHNAFTTYSMQLGSALEVLLLSFGLGYRINLLREEKEKEKREITESVARFVPTEFLNYLGATDIRQVEFGTAVEHDFTVLFTDIRSFTTMSEQMSVEDNFRFLNSYLKRMVPLIHRYDGIIDKFIGDAILALFAGSPTDAVRAAIELRKELIRYNNYRVNTQGYQPIQTGTGLHTGKLMLGTVGFDKKAIKESLNVPEIVRDRLDTTVIGDTVNVAARLQDLTKVYGGTVLISESVYNELTEDLQVATREIDRIRVRGKERDIKFYEVFEGDPDELREQKLLNLASYILARNLFKTGEYGGAL
ncbi:MAG: guanylate cyclase, partial [Leptospiraceae bacterium]|nr:guanylate cyclase [Leptospiraceae bacterium]